MKINNAVFCLLLATLLAPQAAISQVPFDQPNPQPGAEFGSAIARVGDIDGDGVPDLLAGAPLQDVGANTDQGQAYLISGALIRTLDDPFPQAGAKFGAAVASAGDVNGDGILDPLVGAPLQNVGSNFYQGEVIQFQAIGAGGGGGGGGGIDLTGAITRLKHKDLCDKGKGDDDGCGRHGGRRSKERVEFSLQIVNIGTEESRGGFTVRFYLSSDGILDGSDPLIFTKMIKGADDEGRIKPGKKIAVSGNIVVPGSVGGQFLIAFIDADNVIAESNESNNIVARQIP